MTDFSSLRDFYRRHSSTTLVRFRLDFTETDGAIKRCMTQASSTWYIAIPL
jgi:hypothetical protein